MVAEGGPILGGFDKRESSSLQKIMSVLAIDFGESRINAVANKIMRIATVEKADFATVRGAVLRGMPVSRTAN